VLAWRVRGAPGWHTGAGAAERMQETRGANANARTSGGRVGAAARGYACCVGEWIGGMCFALCVACAVRVGAATAQSTHTPCESRFTCHPSMACLWLYACMA